MGFKFKVIGKGQAPKGYDAATTQPAGPSPLGGWGQVDGVLGTAVEVLDRPLTAPDEAQVRAALTAYADSVPHHDLPPLGKRASITGLREHRVYRVHLESLFEKRHAARRSDPLQGTDTREPTVTEANIQVWSYPYPTGKEFRSGCVEHPVEESMQVVACTPCSGCGQVACTTCSSCGTVRCSACGGSGGRKCGQCGGRGQVKERRDVPPKWDYCLACKGGVRDDGTRCWTCNGTGWLKHYYYQESTAACDVCAGSGTAACTSCGGHGKVRCSTCNGKKWLPCSTCQATGRATSYLAVVQTFEPNTQTITVPGSGLKDAAIAGLVQPPDLSPFLILATDTYPADLKLTNGFDGLRAAITRAFTAAVARATQECRLTRQRLQVGMASVLEVGYQFEGEAFTAWLVGRKSQVFAPTSPVMNALAGKLRQAAMRWRREQKKEAVALVQEAVAMAEKDRCCQVVLKEKQKDVPLDLWQAATNPGLLQSIKNFFGNLFG